jgi:hypothetical protein
MTWAKKTFKTWSLLFVLLTGWVFAGCEDTDSREKIEKILILKIRPCHHYRGSFR